MNIVDNTINVYKFVNNVNNRHISYTNNISVWNRICAKYINNNNRKVILNYKMFLNQRDENTIIKCIKKHINIVPIVHQNDELNNYIRISFEYTNILMLKTLRKYFSFELELIHFNYAHINECINLIKYLYKNNFLIKINFVNVISLDSYLITFNMIKFLEQYVKFTRQDFIKIMKKKNFWLSNDCFYIIKYLYIHSILLEKDIKINNDNHYMYGLFCEGKNINVIKYLYKKSLLTKECFKFNDFYYCRISCARNNLSTLEFLHKEVGLTKEDFQIANNCICYIACNNNRIDIIKYLHKEIGLTKEDFQTHNNELCESVCANNHIDIVEYLHKEVKFTKEDFKSRQYLLQQICSYGHVNVVKYLHKEIGFTKEEFEVNNNEALDRACECREYEVVKYLLQDVNVNINIKKPVDDYS